ncbi:hypothetical protein [Streptomyces sp. NPDC050164]|uniref:hypothetical protein n=1 Tax=Streptomyces sp. NPDC050164 TaxID=3365605 RepID=UPI0037938204
MQKRTVGAVIGAAVTGTCLALTMQGSAQATPAVPVAEQMTTVSKGDDKAPQAARAVGKAAAKAATRAAARATVHAKVGARSVANAAGALTDNLGLGSLFSEPANISGEVSDSTAFDR